MAYAALVEVEDLAIMLPASRIPEISVLFIGGALMVTESASVPL